MPNEDPIQFVLASSNPGKLDELQSLLDDLPIEWIPQTELNVQDADETGLTFIENAILKARHAAAKTGLPSLADDSGLVVDALDGAPGVFSARYAGAGASNDERIAKVLKNMEGIPEEERTASFHCVLALIEHENDPTPIICHGVWEGHILEAPRGDKGFGYDPIFYVPSHDCSAAEMNPMEKNLISHRGQAMEQLLAILTDVDY